MSGGAPGRTGIESLDPSFARALELLADDMARDGALTKLDKQLIAVATSAVGDPAACPSAIERAVGAGASTDEVTAIAMSLYLSRGGAPARVVMDGLMPHLAGSERSMGGDPGVTASESTIATSTILSEFEAVFGEVPHRIRLLERHAPEALEAYHRMRVAVLRDGHLDPLLAELILFAVNATEHRSDFAAVHARGARRAGATEAQLVEAGLCSIASGGVAAWLSAGEAIAATDASPANR